MPKRQTTRRASRISTRLRRALADRQFGCIEVSEVLDHATERDVDAYVDVGTYPEVIELFEDVLTKLSEAPWKYGLDKDIPLKLKKWKQSARKRMRTPRPRT